MAQEIDIIFEDAALIAVNKPAGLPSHATAASNEPDLQSQVEAQCNRHLVLLHRLDRDTTGVVLFAKTRLATKAMAAQFESHKLRKAYWAVVHGNWNPTWNRLDTPLVRGTGGTWHVAKTDERGVDARSTFRMLAKAATKTWIEILPKTGRTHQIRAQCAFKQCPIQGDQRYGSPIDTAPMALHATELAFQHPMTAAPVRITALLPTYWHEIWLEEFEIPLPLRQHPALQKR